MEIVQPRRNGILNSYKYTLFQKLTHEEKENINKTVTQKQIERVILKFPTRKTSGPEDLTGKFYKVYNNNKKDFICIFWSF